ncbi:MAG: GntR family transcriptional regulator [Chloroflexota bacterium]
MAEALLRPVGPGFRNLSQHVYDVVLAAILDGRFVPGQRLGYDALAAQLQVSPTPVRDAIYRLEAEGFVEPEGRRGFRVTVLSADDLAHLFDLRLMCELHAVERALAHLTPEALAQIEALAQATVSPDPAEGTAARLAFVRKDREFHVAIVALAGNPRLVEMFVRLNTHTQVLRLSTNSAGRMRATNGPEHVAIAAALATGDAAAVQRAMRLHATNGLQRALASLEPHARRSEALG